MNKLVLAGIALTSLLAAGSATAADMRLKAPPPPPPPTWTGFYLGANAGYGWRDTAQTSFVGNDVYAVAFLTGGLVIPSGPPVVPPAYRLRGGFGGLQAGYNWQVNPYLLVGVEADFQGSSIYGNGTTASLVAPPSLADTINIEQRIRWFGTARARLGFLPTSNWLIYGTGGFAYGQIDESINVGFAGNFLAVTTGINGFSALCVVPGVPNSGNCFTGASSRTASGWTAGGGTEWMVLPNFTVKAEYLYVRLGGGDSFNAVAQTPNPGERPSSFRVFWGSADFHVARVGFNYKLN
jgi:outer membrane immunogenic protein